MTFKGETLAPLYLGQIDRNRYASAKAPTNDKG